MQMIAEIDLDKLPSMLKVMEAAKLLNCSRQHLYKLIKNNKIPFILIGNAIRIPKKDFFEYLSQHTERR